MENKIKFKDVWSFKLAVNRFSALTAGFLSVMWLWKGYDILLQSALLLLVWMIYIKK